MRLLSQKGKKIIGVVHLLPLPGSPGALPIHRVEERAIQDAQNLHYGGVHGLLIENYGDTPFYPERVPPHTVAFMTRVALKIADEFSLPLGINVLRNDALSALSIACAVNADFIRVNVLSGTYVTDQGIITGNAHKLLRWREFLECEVDILADIRVKHASPLASFTLEEELENLLSRALADGIIVTGRRSGEAPPVKELQTIRTLCKKPVVVGSGLKPETAELMRYADAAIVGTYFRGGSLRNPIDRKRVEELMSALESLGF